MSSCIRGLDPPTAALDCALCINSCAAKEWLEAQVFGAGNLELTCTAEEVKGQDGACTFMLSGRGISCQALTRGCFLPSPTLFSQAKLCSDRWQKVEQVCGENVRHQEKLNCGQQHCLYSTFSTQAHSQITEMGIAVHNKWVQVASSTGTSSWTGPYADQICPPFQLQ